MRLGERVLKLRKKFNISQEQLGEQVGVTRQTIISIEQGRYIASLPLALKISKVFDLPVESVFMLEEEDFNE